MTALAFDTYESVKKLKKAGFNEEQAEIITDLQKSTVLTLLEQARHEYEINDLETRHQIKELDLKIESTKAELKRDMTETKAELVRWIIGVGLIQITVIIWLIVNSNCPS